MTYVGVLQQSERRAAIPPRLEKLRSALLFICDRALHTLCQNIERNLSHSLPGLPSIKDHGLAWQAKYMRIETKCDEKAVTMWSRSRVGAELL